MIWPPGEASLRRLEGLLKKEKKNKQTNVFMPQENIGRNLKNADSNPTSVKEFPKQTQSA